MAINDSDNRVEEETTTKEEEEEDTGAQVAPIVKLEPVSVITGEEHEDAILDLNNAELYRFDKKLKQWKERGVGSVKLLKHNQTGKVRLVMRQSKTLKIRANHLVVPVQEYAWEDNSCVWHAADFSDGELIDEIFCIKFESLDNRKQFMETVEQVVESQQGNGENEDATNAAAALLEGLTV